MLLTEYRCTCGKLLFKGLLCQCVVELKCRRCGSITTWGLAEAISYALVESDADARMIEASGDTEGVLGCDRDSLLGRPITELFPFIRDASPAEKPDAPEREYDLADTPLLLLHDGQERRVESCIIPRYRDGAFAGYRIFSVPKRVADA